MATATVIGKIGGDAVKLTWEDEKITGTPIFRARLMDMVAFPQRFGVSPVGPFYTSASAPKDPWAFIATAMNLCDQGRYETDGVPDVGHAVDGDDT